MLDDGGMESAFAWTSGFNEVGQIHINQNLMFIHVGNILHLLMGFLLYAMYIMNSQHKGSSSILLKTPMPNLHPLWCPRDGMPRQGFLVFSLPMKQNLLNFSICMLNCNG